MPSVENRVKYLKDAQQQVLEAIRHIEFTRGAISGNMELQYSLKALENYRDKLNYLIDDWQKNVG